MRDSLGKLIAIELAFAARLVLVNESAEIFRPKANPPAGDMVAKEGEPVYTVNGNVIQGSSHRLRHSGSDELLLRWKIVNDNWDIIEDDHLWPCSVRDFTVVVPIDDEFEISASPKNQWPSN